VQALAEAWSAAVKMDCCNTSEKSKINETGGKMDNKKIILWIIIAALVIAVIYMTANAGNISGQAANTAVQSVQSAGGMVGGC